MFELAVVNIRWEIAPHVSLSVFACLCLFCLSLSVFCMFELARVNIRWGAVALVLRFPPRVYLSVFV